MKKLGLIVNPVAGMGGRVALKGSDGPGALARAKELGAVPESPTRAVEALRMLLPISDRLQIITFPKEMGEEEATQAGFRPIVIGKIVSGATTPNDTRVAALEMKEAGTDLLLFCGGDGTATDIHDAIGRSMTVLGIPAGVKIHSGVYATTPRAAGRVARRLFEDESIGVQDAEVMDIDEGSFRRGHIAARLHGYLRVPDDRNHVQTAKSGAAPSESEVLRSIAVGLVEEMDDGRLYIMGPGTTVGAVMDEMDIPSTLLGVDVVQDKKNVASDVTESDILSLLERSPATIVVTVIGGQGYILGRGNQQISPSVLRKVGTEHVVVVAPPQKLASLSGRPLLVDTGDPQLDETLSGYRKVMTGYRQYAMHRVGD
ncbi:MAG: ATP-NAD kinase family protein [SAR202 cluster bacterium]|jgi:predicted polyphosphate/ATP-dependent NAD kinase|nr:ATP-NAD kinase family protein [SAR202 cluster bacterium]